MQTIAVVDYGMGNLRSVARALEHVAGRARVIITSQPDQVIGADRIVFPGQGAMPDCMRRLHESGLAQAVCEVAKNRPFLGVCVGVHMLCDSSDEGDKPTNGLGIISGQVRRLSSAGAHGERLKVPHMGWNRVEQLQKDHPMWASVPDNAYFYFVHSYYAQVSEPGDVAGQTEYGVRFTSALARDNIFATQFHPEKSASIGLKMYENFVNWKP